MPEVSLHVAQEPYGVWEATEAASGVPDAPPPFWAFSWPGGAALARAVLDGTVAVRGRRVLDLGCGSGLVGIAAALAGAADVTAVDLDPLALAATRLNAGLNGVRVGTVRADLAALAAGAGDPAAPPLPGTPDVVLAGDLFFERELARAALAVLRRAAAAGATVLAGDPGRAHLPSGVFEEVTHYDVPVSPALEDAPVRRTAVLRLAVVG